VCILGRNGVGKTTTLRSIVGLTRPTGAKFSSTARTSRGGRPTASRGGASASCPRTVASSRPLRAREPGGRPPGPWPRARRLDGGADLHGLPILALLDRRRAAISREASSRCSRSVAPSWQSAPAHPGRALRGSGSPDRGGARRPDRRPQGRGHDHPDGGAEPGLALALADHICILDKGPSGSSEASQSSRPTTHSATNI